MDIVEKPTGYTGRDVYGRVSLAILLAYAAFWAIPHWPVAKLTVSLMFLMLIIALVGRDRSLWNDRLLWLMLAWSGYQLVFIPLIQGVAPEYASEQSGAAKDYVKVALVLAVAWLLVRSRLNIAWFLLASASGVLLVTLLQSGGVIDSMDQIASGAGRHAFGFQNAQHTAVYGGFAFVVFTLLSGKIAVGFGHKAVGWSVVAVGITFSSFVVIMTQTRTVWIALFLSYILTAFVYMLLHRRSIARAGSRIALGVLTVTLVLAAFIGMTDGGKQIRGKFVPELEYVASAVTGVEHTRHSSLWIRVEMWRDAVAWIKQRPVFGWGPRTRKMLMENSEFPERYAGRLFGVDEQAERTKQAHVKGYNRIAHVHNSYLETMLAYGAVGIVVFALITAAVAKAVFVAWRTHVVGNDVLLFATAFGAFWFLVNMTESYVLNNTGQALTAIVGGALYALAFASREE